MGGLTNPSDMRLHFTWIKFAARFLFSEQYFLFPSHCAHLERRIYCRHVRASTFKIDRRVKKTICHVRFAWMNCLRIQILCTCQCVAIKFTQYVHCRRHSTTFGVQCAGHSTLIASQYAIGKTTS